MKTNGESFLIENKPCIFEREATANWPSRRIWNVCNAPNFELLKKCFGDCKVPVANCNEKYFNSHHREDMFIESYINYWTEYRKSDYSNKLPLLYLKDWHCVKSHSNNAIYNVPKYFASDWLNEYYTAHQNLNDDYMFIYMGPKGSWTPFHVDVFTSYSWSANIVGRKRWLLFPPGQENHLRSKKGELPYNITSEELNNASKHKSLKCYDIIQESGQIIFVPSGWHHQVWNLEDTISINHNWLNGCNILNIWKSLKKALNAVIKEIRDIKSLDGWTMDCQRVLKADFGMNYFQFYEFLSFIAEKRLNSVINNVPIKSFKQWNLGRKHCLFDLRQIEIVLENFIEDSSEKEISSMLWKNNEAQLLENRIKSVINQYGTKCQK
ncbi:jmjC domain-containing protein 4-like [Copidosoma floridanum]|uniref:jmjC domain-containing protein 4-like n=1 Tax=Copidosoma floridanum TaxID=29053 RepID=UPI000C6F67E8|nr:jmjC domain-containing protein 4-like [Copidosoma floridanum]